MKEIIDKLDAIIIKIFCSVKNNDKKMRRQATEREKIFANKATDKGLISKIYKQLMQLNIKKQTTQSKSEWKTK